MKKSTHILIVEDTAADAELAKRVIRKVLKACDFQVVETRKDFLKALETFQPDVILSDYALPSFDGLTALKLVLKHAPLTPLIIWTGSSSEDVAVDCMKAGANNYVLKENLKRLGPAILRALEEKALLVASKQAEEALQASEKRFRALIENGLDNISLLAADGTLLWESPSSIRTLNYAPNQHLGLSIFDELMHPDDLQWTRDLFTKLVQEPGSRSHTVFRLRHADGTWHWVEAIVTNLLHQPGIHAIVANYRDVNDQKQAEAEVRRSQTKYESLVETSHDLIWSVDAEGKFTFLNRAAKEIYGYEPEELIGHSFFEVMDPEHYHRDTIKFRETIASVNELREVETYVRHRDGRPFILSANSVVIRENGNVIGVTGSSRDITARKQSEKALRESEQRYRALFEDMPIAIWEQDFSQVKKYLEALKQQGVTDFQTYFAAHSDALLECAGKIRILNVNHAAVQMYEAESKEQLIEWTDQDLSKGETEHLPEVFADIAEGRTGNAWEGEEETLTGRPIEISVNWSVTPDNQDDRLRVIVTTL
ncbi:MAG: PAS domain S-box protein, partial [Anaerolineales bacterium]